MIQGGRSKWDRLVERMGYSVLSGNGQSFFVLFFLEFSCGILLFSLWFFLVMPQQLSTVVVLAGGVVCHEDGTTLKLQGV